MRRAARRGYGGPWRPVAAARPTGDSPLAVLGRRFATGETDEDEYGQGLSVLEGQPGRTGEGRAA